MKNFILGIISILLSVSDINAQITKHSDSIKSQLKEIIVTGVIKNKTINSVSENIQVLSEKEIKTNDGLQYATVLNKVPGVFMQNATLNTNRITIRGIGARSPFGTTSIRAYFGEIPLTDGNGASAIEDFELSALSEIEIHKGPSSSSFGVGLGGVLILKPYESFQKETKASFESLYGSFGLFKNTAIIHVGNKNISTNIVYSNTHSDGYRDNNTYDREILTVIATAKITTKNELHILGNYTNLKAFIPSSVNLETYNESPESAAFTWRSSQGFEDFQSFLLGLSWQHDFSSSLQLNSSVFISDKENYEPRPFNILSEDLNGVGFRSSIQKKYKKITWGLGAELFFDTNEYSTFENLYEDFPLGTGSVIGARLSNYQEFRNYVNVFGESTYNITEKWQVNTGINFNKTNYKIEDHFNLGEENQSGNYDFDVIVSPKIGFLYTLNNQIALKTSIAHGFAPPTTEETLLPDGVINTDLQPEKGWNFEIGSHFSFFKNCLFGDVSVYNLRVSDLLVDRRAENDALFAINAGKTSHTGFEGSLNYTFLKTDKITLEAFVNGSIYHFIFDEFLDDLDDFSGNTLTGVPSEVFNTGFNVDSQIGFYGNFNFQHVGSMFVDDANTVSTDSYQLTNIKMGYKTVLKNKLSIHAFLGINNVFNTKYVSQLQVNASAFGGNAPRYYYAGNPINYYGGIKIGYLF